jgi:hypothetical protein
MKKVMEDYLYSFVEYGLGNIKLPTVLAQLAQTGSGGLQEVNQAIRKGVAGIIGIILLVVFIMGILKVVEGIKNGAKGAEGKEEIFWGTIMCAAPLIVISGFLMIWGESPVGIDEIGNSLRGG